MASKETFTETPSGGGILQKIAADIFDVAELFIFCASVILIIFTFVIRPTVVEGPSMEDTLIEKDYLLVSDFAYTPEQGDIVVVHNVGLPLYDDPIIKRVIATEGQTVNIDFATWTVTVDGEVLDEPYMKLDNSDLRTSDWKFPITIPEGYLFVMGDNRNHSADSRSKDIGMIDTRCVVGRAVVRMLPLNRFTLFK